MIGFKLFCASAGAAVLAFATTTVAHGQEPSRVAGTKWAIAYNQDSPAPAFDHGLADLKTLVGSQMGDALESEHAVAGASTEQATTTGLAYFLSDANTPAFTTDGLDHWALKDGVLLGWQGDALQPPPTAWTFTPPTPWLFASVADPRSYLYAIAPDIAPRLACIISHESGWNPSAKNPRSTASGLAQFLNSTWAITPQGRAGYSVFDATKNVEAAVWLYRTFGPTQWEVFLKGYCR